MNSSCVTSPLVALCPLSSWELGWRNRFFQINVFFRVVECKRLEQLKTGSSQSLSHLWSQIKTCATLGVPWPSWGQDGEDFTSPAASWLLAHPLLVPRSALAAGAGRRSLRARVLRVRLNFDSVQINRHKKGCLSLPPLQLKEQLREVWTAPRRWHYGLESCGPQIQHVRSTVCAVSTWRSSLK